MIEANIDNAIVAAAEEGDRQRLTSLSTQFPAQFSLACANGLLEKAHQAKKPDIVLDLILKHKCLVDKATLPMQDIELFGERRAQLHRTLEVFADAARGNTYDDMHDEVRGIGCYDVTNVVRRAAENTMQQNALRPILLESAANGRLQSFIAFVREEERSGEFTLGRHSGTMLGTLENNIAALTAYYSPDVVARGKAVTPTETLPPR